MKKYLIIILLFFLISCTNEQTPQIQKGITLTPKSFEAEDFTSFFEKTNQLDIITWSGDWNELSTHDSAPFVLTELSKTYDYTPIIALQFFTQSSGELLRPLDANTQQQYKDSTLSYVEQYHPKYLALGIETNILYEKSPEDFNNFVQFYNELYNEIKTISPETKIFTIFQLERMKGLEGLFGTKTSTQWELLEQFNQDLVAFTTYPSLIYNSPEEIPDDYYTEIQTHTTKPIAFTEIGWHTNQEPKGYESNEQEQSEFIPKFLNQTSKNTEFIVWSFMYDQDTTIPFNSMGLYKSDGTEKLSAALWLK